MVPWCSGLTRLPVKEEIGSSNLLGIANNMNNLLKIGDINITGLTDGPNIIDPTILFPETPIEAWKPFYDIFPEYFEGKYFKVKVSNKLSSIFGSINI